MASEIPCCPSCESTDVAVTGIGDGPGCCCVDCLDGCLMTGPGRDTPEAAIAAWAALHGPGRECEVCETEHLRGFYEGLRVGREALNE